MAKRKRFRAILCTMVDPDAAEKLDALIGMNDPTGALKMGNDLAGMVLEMGIREAWEMYRNNPKHSHQIKDWESENQKKES